jgi:SAM-dependent methyltransferase
MKSNSAAASRWKEYRRLAGRIAPTLVSNRILYGQVLSDYVSTQTIWLDAGCGHLLLGSSKADEERDLVQRARFACGCDGDVEAIRHHRSLANRVVCDLTALPFKPGSFTLITSNMVVEHLDNPEQVFREFAGLLKPGGVVMVHTPNRWSYYALLSALVPQAIKNRIGTMIDGRPPEDYYPVRYRANSPGTLRRLFHDVGLQEQQVSMYASDAIFQFLADRMWGRMILRMELYLLKLSLQPGWRFLRLSICAVYKKPG